MVYILYEENLYTFQNLKKNYITIFYIQLLQSKIFRLKMISTTQI